MTGRTLTPRREGSRRSGTSAPDRRPMPAGHVLAVLLIALNLGGLLNVGSLGDAARRQEPGISRTVSIWLVWPYEQVSGLLGLDQPSRLLAERLGRAQDAGRAGRDDASDGVTAIGAAPEEALPAGDALVAAAVERDPGLADMVAIDPGVDPDAPALNPRLEGPFTIDDPLQVAVVGDSMTEQVGPAIIGRTQRPGVHADSSHDFTVSSGLSRPDFYSWPERIAQLAEERDPDIWVVMMGANDGQDVTDADGVFRQMGSDEWEAIYRGRVGALMDQLTQDGRAVVWLGLPIMRDGGYDERMAYITGLYEDEASTRPFVSYIDARSLFGDEGGAYAEYLPGPDGQLIEMRLGDGIHLTRAGAELLASQVMPLLPVDS